MMRFTARRFGAPAAPAVVERYGIGMRWMHWTMAGCMITGIGSVLYVHTLPEAERDYMKPTPHYAKAMWLHESCGMTVAILVPFRVGMMLVQKRPGHLPSPFPSFLPDRMAHAVATYMHYVLYGFFICMSGTGIGMAYASAMNIPFWFTEIPVGQGGKSAAWNDWNYEIHSFVGKYGKYLIPVHVGGALVHQARGHAIFARMNPFA